jgi:hypothetical protein|tara:strand:- start:552 stop:749 length:198 start_codon:yes stop_codon:yes gene_type:complete
LQVVEVQLEFALQVVVEQVVLFKQTIYLYLEQRLLELLLLVVVEQVEQLLIVHQVQTEQMVQIQV